MAFDTQRCTRVCRQDPKETLFEDVAVAIPMEFGDGVFVGQPVEILKFKDPVDRLPEC